MKLLGFGRQAKQREKERRRRAAFDDAGTWVRDGQFVRRTYASYQDYLDHQAAKLDKIRERLEKKEAESLAEFRRRFEGCAPLREARSVLCLGARLGTEVQALHQLGHFAVGIDLNPGPDNPRVLPGDFHRLVFPDGSVDAVYTNALDHAFELSTVMTEIARVLRPGGLALLDLMNPARIRAGLVPHSRTERDGHVLDETRSLSEGGRRVVKEVVLETPAGEVRRWREDVRLYEGDELGRLLAAAGLVRERVVGGFDGAPYGPGSERQIVLARRAPARPGA